MGQTGPQSVEILASEEGAPGYYLPTGCPLPTGCHADPPVLQEEEGKTGVPF